jgi:flavin reductase (DIM6/NTAB) family NADH-FMN oxidoreductase RutF
MEKISIKPATYLFPMPTTIVGATVNGKPNYLAIAYCGTVQAEPPMLSVALNRHHYTNAGIRENRTFSVNIPSESMVEVTDYVGIYSGRNVDKAALFETFYGELKTAPMIKECPVNMECRLAQVVDIPGRDELFIGEIVSIHSDEAYLTGGMPDIAKIRPIIFSFGDHKYWKLGECLGPAWSIGKDLNGKARHT